MKILHVWNTAGVPQTLARVHTQLQFESHLVVRKGKDKYNQLEAVRDHIKIYERGSGKDFRLFIMRIAWKYDIIHVHSVDIILADLRKIYKKKTIILSYHGSDIRGKWSERQEYWKLADMISVSTKDLLEGAPSTANHIANPVDTFHFTSTIHKPLPKSALFLDSTKDHHFGYAIKIAKNVAKELGLNMVIYNSQDNPIPYSSFPAFLGLFEYMLDIKNEADRLKKIVDDRSFAGLQAHEIGVKVLNHRSELYEPDKTSVDILTDWLAIYETILPVKNSSSL